MEYINDIWQIVMTQIEWAILILVIVVGEITKKVWVTQKINNYYKVLITTLPMVIIYAILKQLPAYTLVLSYPLAFWIYPLIIRWILLKLGIKKG